jgi:transcription elongation factor SPT6
LWQLSEELTGFPSTDNVMIEEESIWILNQLTGEGCVSFFGNGHKIKKDIDQKDIASVLTMLHVYKFEVCRIIQGCFMILYSCSSNLFFLTCQIPFIALYRKESCLSLLEEEDFYDNDINDKNAHPPKTRFHKVIFTMCTSC